MPFFSRSDRPDSAQRRRREDGDRGARLSFEVESVEVVPAGEGLGLLRLAGAWSADPERVVPLPIEVEIERDGEAVRVPVLPDPSAPDAFATPGGEHWRGAFMAETELAEDPRSDFALVAGGEVIAGLPRPGDMELDEGYVHAADEDEPPAAEAAGELSDHEDGDAHPPALSELLAELERVAAMDEAVKPLEIEPDDVVAEHLAAREAADARAETAEAHAVAAEARAEAAESRAGEAESTVALLRHELESLRGVTAAAEATLAELRQNADRERSAREDAEAATALVREEVQAERTAREQAEAALEELRGQSERDRAGRENQQEALAELRSEVERERTAREASEAKLSEALATLEQEHQRHRATEAEASGELDGARQETEAARSETDQARREAEDARRAADEARREADTARQELESASGHDESAAWERERADLIAQMDALRLDGDRQREHERKAEENERKLAAMQEHLDQARKELDLERRRSSSMEEELRMQVSVERQLRDSLAGQEADLAAATADAARRERIAERRGDDPNERDGDSRSHEVKDDFFSRVEQAKRLSETS